METTIRPDYARVLKQMMSVIRVQEMYPPEHPATLQATEKPFAALQEIFKRTDHLTISKVKDAIIVNGVSIEGASLPERLLEEFRNENINSLTFTKNLSQKELSKFLSFFVKSFDKDAPSTSLPEFLKMNQIQSIRVDQLRYELVFEDEVVVKAEVLEGAELKTEISKIMRDNPDLVRDILLNKSPKKESFEGKLSSGIDLPQLINEIGKQLRVLSDDEILSLLASGLSGWIPLSKDKISKPDLEDSGSKQNQMVDLVHKLLQDREKKKLLPEVKRILSEHKIVEEKHFDFIFDEKWLKSQAVLDELLKMIEKLGIEEVDMDKFMFLWQRVISSEETKIKLYVMDKLLFKLDSESNPARSLAVFAIQGALNHFIKEKMEFEFTHIKDLLYEKIKKDQQMPAWQFKNYTELLKVIFWELIRRGEFKEAHKILLEYNLRSKIVSEAEPPVQKEAYPQEVETIPEGFIREVSDESTLNILTSYLKEGVPSQDIKLVEEILESLDKDKVAQKLLDIFTLPDRVARMSALRVLCRLGKSSVSALSSLLSHPSTFIRKKGGEALEDESWYKVRNSIYVLGNIPNEESLQTLSRLNKDPDIRVRLEIIKAVEKIGDSELSRTIGDGERADARSSGRSRTTNPLLTFLNDPEDEVRKNAITSLGRVGDKDCLPSLIEHFRHNPKDRLLTLSAIGKIGGERFLRDGERSRTIEFLFNLLWEEDVGIENLSSKQKDEIQISALNILGKIGSFESAGEIEKFVGQKKKGLRGLLVNERLIESANRALKMIKSRQSKAPLVVR